MNVDRMAQRHHYVTQLLLRGTYAYCIYIFKTVEVGQRDLDVFHGVSGHNDTA